MDIMIPNRRSDGSYEVLRQNPNTGVFERCNVKGGNYPRTFPTEADARKWISDGAPEGPFVLDAAEF